MNDRSVYKRIGLSHALRSDSHTELLVIMYTAKTLSATAANVLRRHGLTEAQFNVLILLGRHCEGATSQSDLSRRMLVNRANITGLVDRMERDGLVERVAKAGDRRVNLIQITSKGRKQLSVADCAYQKVVGRITADVSEAGARKAISQMLSICDACENEV